MGWMGNDTTIVKVIVNHFSSPLYGWEEISWPTRTCSRKRSRRSGLASSSASRRGSRRRPPEPRRSDGSQPSGTLSSEWSEPAEERWVGQPGKCTQNKMFLLFMPLEEICGLSCECGVCLWWCVKRNYELKWNVYYLQKVSRVVGDTVQGIEQSKSAKHRVHGRVTDLAQLGSKQLHHYIVTMGLNAHTHRHTYSQVQFLSLSARTWWLRRYFFKWGRFSELSRSELILQQWRTPLLLVCLITLSHIFRHAPGV